MKIKGILNAYQLKLIMLVLMLADHLYYYLFPRELLLAHYISRVVAPVFAFFIAEGMVYTKSRTRYMLRLFAAGAVMSAGNQIIYLFYGERLPNNIFLSLAAGAAAVHSIDCIKRNGLKGSAVNIAAIVLILCALPFLEGEYLVPVWVLIFYYLKKTPAAMCAVYVCTMAALSIPGIVSSGTVPFMLFSVFAVLPIELYNGERGSNSVFAKYLFYIFYPVHIWVIYAVSRII